MKHITAALAAFLVLNLSIAASAADGNLGDSILVSGYVSAPRIDASQPPVTIDPPIVAGAIDKPPGLRSDDHVQHRSHERGAAHDDHSKHSPSVFDKLKALDRKKNAWLKRKLLGK